MRVQTAFASFGQILKHSLRTALLTCAVGSLLPAVLTAQSITVASPASGSVVPPGVWVRAHSVGCNGLAPIAFGYSVDGSNGLTLGVTPYDIDLSYQNIPNGTHTIYYKAWTAAGICPVASTTFAVGTSAPGSTAPGTSAPSYSVPSYAQTFSNIENSGGWQFENDGATNGWSQGSTVFPATTPSSDSGRELYMTYSNHGGERWHTDFGSNGAAQNFALDTYVYLENPDQVQNLELDLNQVMSDGETIIYGTQCSSVSNTWEFSYTYGSSPRWAPSNVPCNPRAWAPNTWHHVQIGMHRDSNGTVTHDWVNVDGVQSVFSNAVGGGGLWLGWAPGALVTNVQVDGFNVASGSTATFIHNLTVYSW